VPDDDHRRRASGANRLARCASAYLRQHAHNPVDWYPWGPEALERARREDRPILLSIGYSACHWCHVMAHECFEDPGIAALMNEHFVCVKVDREERPDLDALYMRAVQLLTSASGWPQTMFLTPERVPFYAGTYFPPEDRAGMPGFPRVLEAVRDAYAQNRGDVHKSAGQVLEALRKESLPEPARGALSDELWEPVLRTFASRFDMEQGGFGLGAKFPQAPVLEFLLGYWGHRGDARAHLIVTSTLEKMAAGGLFDQLGGGFHRYAVDRDWRIPHFEKMLCDNAQLVGLYADAHRATRRPGLLETAVATADYLLREMRGADGGFFASQDADADGREGVPYAWTYGQITDCLGKQPGRLVARYFGADRDGNWEDGRNVLHRSLTLDGLAGLFEIGAEEAAAVLRDGTRRLFEARRQRPQPAVDRKVLTDWNALTASGLVRLWRATHEPRHLRAARQCVELLLGAARPEGALMHVFQDGRAEVPAFLSDLALLCNASLDLYEATFEPAYLRAARELAAAMVGDCWDDASGVFAQTGRRSEELIAPLHDLGGGPTPSGNASACRALLRLSALGRDDGYADLARRALTRCLPLLAGNPAAVPGLLSAALRLLSPPRELVVVGLDAPGADELLLQADEAFVADLVRAGARTGEAAGLAAEVPLLEGRQAVEGKATAYLCVGGTCREPVREPDALRQQLAALVPGRRVETFRAGREPGQG